MVTWLELERGGATLAMVDGKARGKAPPALRAAMSEAMEWRLAVLRPQAARGLSCPEARPAAERPHHEPRTFTRFERGAIHKHTIVRPKYGHCLSCGDALQEHWMQYDCVLCVVAWAVARRDAGRAAA